MNAYVTWKWLIGATAAAVLALSSTALAVLETHTKRPHEGAATVQEVAQMEQRVREDIKANRELLHELLRQKKNGN